MAGCPALAVSLDSFTWEKYDTAAALAVRVLDWMKLHPLRRGEIYNLNVPAREDVKGVFFTQTLAPEFLTDANYQEFTSHYTNAVNTKIKKSQKLPQFSFTKEKVSQKVPRDSSSATSSRMNTSRRFRILS